MLSNCWLVWRSYRHAHVRACVCTRHRPTGTGWHCCRCHPFVSYRTKPLRTTTGSKAARHRTTTNRNKCAGEGPVMRNNDDDDNTQLRKLPHSLTHGRAFGPACRKHTHTTHAHNMPTEFSVFACGSVLYSGDRCRCSNWWCSMLAYDDEDTLFFWQQRHKHWQTEKISTWCVVRLTLTTTMMTMMTMRVVGVVQVPAGKYKLAENSRSCLLLCVWTAYFVSSWSACTIHVRHLGVINKNRYSVCLGWRRQQQHVAGQTSGLAPHGVRQIWFSMADYPCTKSRCCFAKAFRAQRWIPPAIYYIYK